MSTPDEIEPRADERVGIVGSDTTTHTLVVDLIASARERSLNGRMVLVAPRDNAGHREYGLGTVTEIVNRNQYHEDPALRGVIALRGGIGNLTGRGDIKTAKVEMSAVFRPNGEKVAPVGGSLTFAPNTGEPVHIASEEAIDGLARRTTDDLFYLGTLYRQPVLMPMTLPDFSGARGASMSAFFGPSGSGKSFLGTLFVASQMRHQGLGFLLIDPQGQFTTSAKVNRELPLDLRALAEAQGREVIQLSVAREVRLPEDTQMFCSMLATSPFFYGRHLINVGKQKNQEVSEMLAAWLDDQHKWSEQPVEDFLDSLVTHVMNLARSGSIFTSMKEPSSPDEDLPDTRDPANRLYHDMRSVLHPDEYDSERRDGERRRGDLLKVLTPFLSLFSPKGLDGSDRRKIGDIVHTVTDTKKDSAGKRTARPFYILTLADQLGDTHGGDSGVSRALASTTTQSIILRSLFSALERTARWRYQETDRPANVMVILDEAARFASVKDRRDDYQRDIAEDLARNFRELRKYAVGFTLLLQEPALLHDSIWKQLRNGFRAFAGGLVGSDLDKIREQIGNTEALRLYSQLAQPSHDNPVYPFMLCGAISPLSATGSPLFMETFSGDAAAQEWAKANSRWLPGIYNTTDTWRPPHG